MTKLLTPKILLILLMHIFTSAVSAHDIEVKNAEGVTIYYNWINNNTEVAVSYRGENVDSYKKEYSGNVVIPESIYNGIILNTKRGYPVPTTSVASVYSNMFKGSESKQTICEHETIGEKGYFNYYLSKGIARVGFYRVTKVDGVKIGENRYYLPILNKDASSSTCSAGSAKSQITFQESDVVIRIPLCRDSGFLYIFANVLGT